MRRNYGNSENSGYHSAPIFATASKYGCFSHHRKRLNATLTENSCQTDNKLFNSKESNATDILQNLQVEKPNRLIIRHLNKNLIRNKFEMLPSILSSSRDIIMISEITLEESFPINQFLIQLFTNPVRFDGTHHGGGFLFYIKEDIAISECKDKKQILNPFLQEINVQKKKWLRCCCYNPRKSMMNEHLNVIQNLVIYDNTLIAHFDLAIWTSTWSCDLVRSPQIRLGLTLVLF